MTRFFVRRLLPALLLLTTAIFLLNTSRLAPARTGEPVLLAHRGLGQTFSRENLDAGTCTAARIHAPKHPYIEVTIPAIAAAFGAGADIVEFDIQPTSDGEIVVFHDWTLECRTDGTGLTREHTLAELQALDVGYGYTADGGATYPLRGRGVGLMPTLREVFDAFPGNRFLINIKSADPAEGRLLASVMEDYPPDARSAWTVYGSAPAIDALRERLPELRTLRGDQVVECLVAYETLGWSGYVPTPCRNTLMMVPVDYAGWLWGFPARLLDRLDGHGTLLVLLGPYDGPFSAGIDDSDAFELVPPGFDGGIWTNRVDLIGALTAEPR